MMSIPVHFEIESKMKVEQLAGYAERISELGGKLCGRVEQRDCYFDRQDCPLLKNDSGLRVREDVGPDGSKISICFKGPRQKGIFKRREEIEIELAVSDSAKASLLLKRLDYAPRLTVEKNRQLWQLDNCLVCLDKVKKLGCFVEIEGPDEQTINAVAAKIGLKDNKHIRSSYVEMLGELWEHNSL